MLGVSCLALQNNSEGDDGIGLLFCRDLAHDERNLKRARDTEKTNCGPRRERAQLSGAMANEAIDVSAVKATCDERESTLHVTPARLWRGELRHGAKANDE